MRPSAAPAVARSACWSDVSEAADPREGNGSVIARAVVVGIVVLLAGTPLPRNAAFAANLRFGASLPWSAPLMAAYVWFFWRYAGGWGPPEATAEERRASSRAGRVPAPVWAWSLLTGLIGIVTLVLALRFANRLVVLPEQTLPDLRGAPRSTVLTPAARVRADRRDRRGGGLPGLHAGSDRAPHRPAARDPDHGHDVRGRAPRLHARALAVLRRGRGRSTARSRTARARSCPPSCCTPRGTSSRTSISGCTVAPSGRRRRGPQARIGSTGFDRSIVLLRARGADRRGGHRGRVRRARSGREEAGGLIGGMRSSTMPRPARSSHPEPHDARFDLASPRSLLPASPPSSFASPAAMASKSAKPAGERPLYGAAGFDDAGMDKSTRPGDDFFRYANGTLARPHVDPARPAGLQLASRDDRSHRATPARDDGGRGQDGRARAQDRSKARSARSISSFMDEARIDALGASPLAATLDADPRRAQHRAELAALMGRTNADFEGSLFNVGIDVDLKDPKKYAVYLSQAGLGLPDRDYYLDARFATQKAKYQDYAATLLRLLELAESRASGTRRRRLRDQRSPRRAGPRRSSAIPIAIYNPMKCRGRSRIARAGLRVARVPRPRPAWPASTRVIVGEKSAFPKLAAGVRAHADRDAPGVARVHGRRQRRAVPVDSRSPTPPSSMRNQDAARPEGAERALEARRARGERRRLSAPAIASTASATSAGPSASCTARDTSRPRRRRKIEDAGRRTSRPPTTRASTTLDWMGPGDQATRRSRSSIPTRSRSAIPTQPRDYSHARRPRRRSGRQRARARRPRLGLLRRRAARAGRSRRLGHDAADQRRLQRLAARHRRSRPASCSRRSSTPTPIRRSTTAPPVA